MSTTKAHRLEQLRGRVITLRDGSEATGIGVSRLSTLMTGSGVATPQEIARLARWADLDTDAVSDFLEERLAERMSLSRRVAPDFVSTGKET